MGDIQSHLACLQPNPTEAMTAFSLYVSTVKNKVISHYPFMTTAELDKLVSRPVYALHKQDPARSTQDFDIQKAESVLRLGRRLTGADMGQFRPVVWHQAWPSDQGHRKPLDNLEAMSFQLLNCLCSSLPPEPTRVALIAAVRAVIQDHESTQWIQTDSFQARVKLSAASLLLNDTSSVLDRVILPPFPMPDFDQLAELMGNQAQTYIGRLQALQEHEDVRLLLGANPDGRPIMPSRVINSQMGRMGDILLLFPWWWAYVWSIRQSEEPSLEMQCFARVFVCTVYSYLYQQQQQDDWLRMLALPSEAYFIRILVNAAQLQLIDAQHSTHLMRKMIEFLDRNMKGYVSEAAMVMLRAEEAYFLRVLSNDRANSQDNATRW